MPPTPTKDGRLPIESIPHPAAAEFWVTLTDSRVVRLVPSM